jgi:hypothetical protein
VSWQLYVYYSHMILLHARRFLLLLFCQLTTVYPVVSVASLGTGCSRRQLIKAIGATSPDERCLIPARYKTLFGKKLLDVMKSECGKKDFGTAIQFLAVDPVEAECMMIDKACKGAGTDELLLATIICGRTNKEMDMLKVRLF